MAETIGEALGGRAGFGRVRERVRSNPVVRAARAQKKPVSILEKLNREINTALADPAMKARLAEQGSGTVFTGSAANFGRLIAEDTEKWGKVVRFAGLRPE
jgi:tripartite-type tricarboxylate transporter receptor subunit TctC